MQCLFLSSDAWCPMGPESDTVSLLINDSIMVDTGWHPMHNLLREGKKIEDVHTLLLTHLHQDHRIGLPAILFYLLNGCQSADKLTIYGVDGVKRIVQMALDYAGKDEYFSDYPGPHVSTVSSGQTMFIDNLQIATLAGHHAVPSLVFRFTDPEGHSITYSSDTAYFPELAAFAKDTDVLIFEHSYGARRDYSQPDHYGHSDACEAARCALECGAKALYLVHAHPQYEESALKVAREIFPNTFRAHSGDRINL